MSVLRRSLVRRLTIGFILSNAAAVLLFLLVLYPLRSLIEDDPIGPELALLHLEDDLSLNPAAGLQLRPDAGFLRLAAAHPAAWFVVRSAGQELTFGHVPDRLPHDGEMDFGVVREARYRALGAQGGAGDAMTAELEIDGVTVTASAGGIDSATIGFSGYIDYTWRSGLFVLLPAFTALFNLAGGLIAIPIILRSVRSTARQAAALDASDLSRRLDEVAVDKELLPLVGAVNAALSRLQATFERRKRFIADVAHELRTPLAVLAMHVDALPEGGRKPDLQRVVFRLGHMVGQMLDAERLVLAGRRQEEVDLIEITRTAVSEAAPLAVASGYEVEFHSPAGRVWITGDAHAIARALTNLLGNAVAHGGNQGTIRVFVGTDRYVDVRDEGPGIPDEARNRIFEPFHRERWDKDGCGLGLHLVAEIMRAHGGSIQLLQGGPGATFRLQFSRSEP